ncbi:hypothetical protein [Ovoidimarina sediminis]|uniref:hypothetical protein n=1 Tax=Ovoidimarina sediminis TaxID=3079856 RepID=UPI0029096658|nr:hypothetical protein [Rhodophyticola sp. MJ-SS7]MDU8942972.1 hypothetical protein [Rhodophyticola sp. MJ-SS7]
MLFALLGGLLLAGHLGVEAASGLLDVRSRLANEIVHSPFFWGLLLAYVLLMTTPFVPGAEIGLLLLVTLGADAAGYVYIATVTALLLAYSLGRLVPLDALWAAWVTISPSDVPRVPDFDGSAHPIARSLLRHRCCAVALLLNLPGNAVLGGGGGIAFAAGLSRTITVPQFALTVAIAVAPVPAAVFLGASLSP